jgi:hypothetical protein
MTASLALLKMMRLCATLDPSQFIHEHVLNGAAAVCEPEEYVFLINELARTLSVPSTDLRLVGSGKLGFSLNPDHLLRPFGRDSDLDFVVVSADLFDSASLELLVNNSAISLASESERRKLRKTRENVFNGFLRADQLPTSSSLSREWFPRLAGPFDSKLARSHPVKAWLFRSFDHARIFYTNHQRKVQPSVAHILNHRGDL